MHFNITVFLSISALNQQQCSGNWVVVCLPCRDFLKTDNKEYSIKDVQDQKNLNRYIDV